MLNKKHTLQSVNGFASFGMTRKMTPQMIVLCVLFTMGIRVAQADPVTPAMAVPSVGASTILTFKEWKMEKVQASLQRMNSLRAQIQVLKMESGNKDILPLERSLAQESWNLEVIKDLGVSDYFILYVKPMKNSNKYRQLATKMSPDELTEVLETFSKNLSSNDERPDSSTKEAPALPAVTPSLASPTPTHTTLINPSRLSIENTKSKF